MNKYWLVEETIYTIDRPFKVWELYQEELLVGEFYYLCIATKVLEALNNPEKEENK